MAKPPPLGKTNRAQAAALAALLVAALAGDAAIIYLRDDPLTRTGFALLLMLPIMWMSNRLGVVELALRAVTEWQERRYRRLRGHVGQLLEEIRRLNWTAVDVERGFRNRASGMHDMDQLEEQLKNRIHQIREAAGHDDPDADTA